MRLARLFLGTLIVAATACGGSPATALPDGGDAAIPPTDAGVPGGAVGDACLPAAGVGTPLVTGLRGARRLAANDAYLFASVTGTPTQPQGRVLRVPLAGGPAEEIATELLNPDAIAAVGDAAFVIDDQGLWRIDLGTLARTRIDATPVNALFGDTELLVDADALLVATGFRWLVRVQQDGTGARVLYEGAAGTSVRGLARNGSDVFFFVALGAEPGLYRVPIDGSAPAVRLRNQPSEARTLYLDGDRLVWTEGEGGSGRIVSAGLDGKNQQVLAQGLARPARLARLGDALYFKDKTTAASEGFFGAIGRCGVQPVGPVGMGPGDVLVKDGVVFFTSADLTSQGDVARLP